MFPSPTNKKELIELVISLFGREGEEYLHTKGSNFQRDSEEIFLLEDFCSFIRKKHPYFNKRDAKAILEQMKDEDKSLQAFNKYFFQVLRESFAYRREEDGNTYSVNLLDFKDFENNIFRIVDGISFKATQIDYEFQNAMSSEIDLIVYINGLPLFVWEFSSPKKNIESKTELLLGALQSIEYNEKSIPELFRYNAFCVICGGLRAIKYGISWGGYQDYKEWKRVFETVQAQGENVLFATIKGLFCKWRIIEILETFICFSDTDYSKKIICRYPQYFGATKLLRSIEDRCKNKHNSDGKGGVYFGATGCGKSYTMLFLSKLLLSSPELNRPTILLITDRTALNHQLSKLFQDYKEYLQCEEIVRINISKGHLKKTISSSVAGGIYLTNIQKFRAINEILSNRWNFVCISDEAHRTQDSLGGHYKDEGNKLRQSRALAQILHDSLPNATYVGFTATPREQTLDAFGGVVDAYGMLQSVRDGFTVRILSETRETRLKLDETVAKEIDNIYEEMARVSTSQEKIQDDQEKRVRWRKTLSSPKILEVIAEDIINHYERRVRDKSTTGKAMIVVDSREAACVMYNILQKLRPRWFEEQDSLFPEKSMVNLVISQNFSDSEEVNTTVSGLISSSRLANEFKKDKSSFKIAIVCGMWLTGFDVPSLDTMYLNKYITGHELIQAISRVNRSYEDEQFKKRDGLVVFYVPLKRELNKAMESLQEMGGGGGVVNLDDIVAELEIKLHNLDRLLSVCDHWNIERFLEEDEIGKKIYVKKTIDWLTQQQSEYRQEVLTRLKEIGSKYRKCISYDTFQQNKKCRNQVMLFEVIYRVWRSPTQSEQIKGKEIDELMKQAFSVQTIQADSMEEAINLNFDYRVTREEALPAPVDEQGEYLTKEEEDSIWQISELQEQVEQGKSISERLKRLIARYNSAWDEQEKMKIAQEIKEEIEKEKERETFSKEEQIKKREEWRINLISQKVLMPIKNKNQFDFSEEKIEELAKGLKEIGDEYTSFIDWDKKTAVKSRLKQNWKSLLNKKNWPPRPDVTEGKEVPYEVSDVIKETCENLLFVFKNFSQEERKMDEERK